MFFVLFHFSWFSRISQIIFLYFLFFLIFPHILIIWAPFGSINHEFSRLFIFATVIAKKKLLKLSILNYTGEINYSNWSRGKFSTLLTKNKNSIVPNLTKWVWRIKENNLEKFKFPHTCSPSPSETPVKFPNN